MDIKKAIQSKNFSRVLIGLGSLLAAALIFQAGVAVGYRKAAFSFSWGDKYYRSFGGPRGQFAPGMPRGGFPDAHGSSGRVITIDLPTLVIQDRDGVEKVVLIKDDTVIRRFRDTVRPEDVKVDDLAVIIGEPNDESQIEAKLIRLMEPGSMMGPGPMRDQPSWERPEPYRR